MENVQFMALSALRRCFPARARPPLDALARGGPVRYVEFPIDEVEKSPRFKNQSTPYLIGKNART